MPGDGQRFPKCLRRLQWRGPAKAFLPHSSMEKILSKRGRCGDMVGNRIPGSQLPTLDSRRSAELRCRQIERSGAKSCVEFSTWPLGDCGPSDATALV